jgi:hypothetical protein
MMCLDACDMRCLMDKVYQQKDVGLVTDFVYEAPSLIPGQLLAVTAYLAV